MPHSIRELIIEEECKEVMLNEARKSPKKEIVFLLVGSKESNTGIGQSIERLTNLSRRADNFIISQAEYLMIEQEVRAKDLEVLALGHSHPSGDVAPSRADLHSLQKAKQPWIIIGVQEGGLNILALAPNGASINICNQNQ